jgi:hypothetical protein
MQRHPLAKVCLVLQDTSVLCSTMLHMLGSLLQPVAQPMGHLLLLLLQPDSVRHLRQQQQQLALLSKALPE